ncbi:unnamed protein product [Adineta ricciae]|uniref:Annexin n=1 Tax=Adineta ricciae TaxID=249248 RepID=A0A814X9X8_ADIRI|nr:unnamed protein product [Adineta ricciae]CAF1212088.1 unnamed protein product [Adineta ricciae]
MKKTLTRSKTFDGDLFKVEKRLTRQSTLPSFAHAAEFDYKRDTKQLMKILKNCVTAHMLDLDCILHFLSAYSCEQRMIIIHDLDYEYHYNLIDMVLKRPESPIRSCTLAMLVEPVELCARHFHDFLTQKLTKNDDKNVSRVLLEILLGLNNDDVRKFKETYELVFGAAVQNDITVALGAEGILPNLLIQLLQGERYEDSAGSSTTAKYVAKGLYEATSDTPIIDDDTLIKIFTQDSFSQLSSIFDFYEDKYGQPFLQAIERRFQNPIEIQYFQDIIEFTHSPSSYYSHLLRQAQDKTPIDYVTIIRIILGREEKDLAEIKLEYSKIYDETLDETLKQRLDNLEIKRLLIMIVTGGVDITVNDGGPVRFDHANNSNSTNSGSNSPSATTNGHQGARKFSHEAFDRFVNVFKQMRSH